MRSPLPPRHNELPAQISNHRNNAVLERITPGSISPFHAKQQSGCGKCFSTVSVSSDPSHLDLISSNPQITPVVLSPSLSRSVALFGGAQEKSNATISVQFQGLCVSRTASLVYLLSRVFLGGLTRQSNIPSTPRPWSSCCPHNCRAFQSEPHLAQRHLPEYSS